MGFRKIEWTEAMLKILKGPDTDVSVAQQLGVSVVTVKKHRAAHGWVRPARGKGE